MLERHDLKWRMAALPCLRAQAVDPADQALIKLRIGAHGVEHLGAALNEPRQDVVHICDRKGILSAVFLRRSIGPGASAVPGLACRVAVAYKKNVLGLLSSGHEHSNRFRLVES